MEMQAYWTHSWLDHDAEGLLEVWREDWSFRIVGRDEIEYFVTPALRDEEPARDWRLFRCVVPDMIHQEAWHEHARLYPPERDIEDHGWSEPWPRRPRCKRAFFRGRNRGGKGQR